MTQLEIHEHVSLIRWRIQRLAAARTEPLDRVIGGFPQSFCQNAARLILRYFHELLGVDKRDLAMCVNAESKDKMTHAWCIVCGFHVDITADQFDRGEAVIVSGKHPMIGYFSEPDLCDYDESQHINSEWREMYYEPLFLGVQTA